MAIRYLAMASAFVPVAFSQSTSVTSLFLYGAEGDSIVASVISAGPEATTYFVTCPVGTDASDCGFGPGATVVNGPSTAGLHITESGAFSMDATCTISANTANCVETDAGVEANFPGTSTVTMSDVDSSLLAVTITAGLDALSAGATTTGTVSSTASVSGTAQPSSTATTSKPSATGTASGASSTATSGGSRTGWSIALAGIFGMVGVSMSL